MFPLYRSVSLHGLRPDRPRRRGFRVHLAAGGGCTGRGLHSTDHRTHLHPRPRGVPVHADRDSAGAGVGVPGWLRGTLGLRSGGRGDTTGRTRSAQVLLLRFLIFLLQL